MLTVKGKQIINSKGEPVHLKGTCIGGWMNLENFINGFPGTEMGIRSALSATLGEGRIQFFFDRMLHHFFNEDDILFIKQCGANVVRIALNYRHFEEDLEPFKYKEVGFERLAKIVALCEKHQVYVILDLHAVQGYQNAHWHSDNPRGISLFWDQLQFQDRFVALWEELARRYAGKAVIAGYNIMNEPCVNTPRGDYPYNFFENYQPQWDKLNRVYCRVVHAIRKIDPDHILFLEGDNYSRLFAGLAEPFADNLVYSSHSYTAPGFGPGLYPGKFAAINADGIKVEAYWDRKRQAADFQKHEGTQFADKYHVPLWVGEFGSQYNGPEAELSSRLRSVDDQIDVFEEHGVHWTTWTYKDVGVMGWVMLDPASPYMKLIAPVQQMKGLLGAENFTGRYITSPVKEKMQELASLMEKVIGEPALSSKNNRSCLADLVLSSYGGGLLEPVYAEIFRGMSENQLDSLLESFAFKNCKVNTGLSDILKKHFCK